MEEIIPHWQLFRRGAGNSPIRRAGSPRLVITDRESGSAKVTIRYAPSAAASGPWRVDWDGGHVFLTSYQLLDAFGGADIPMASLGKYSRYGNVLDISMPGKEESIVSILLNREISKRVTALIEVASSA